MAQLDVAVIGLPDVTRPLAAALRRVQLLPRLFTPMAALRSPGCTAGAALTIFTGSPGRQPTLEAEVYTDGTGALHVAWDANTAEVGPFVTPGFGPCPACLARDTAPGPGEHRALVAWASSWAALQALAIVDGSTDLIGASWTWRLGAPGLGLVTWQRRPRCPARQCRQP